MPDVPDILEIQKESDNQQAVPARRVVNGDVEIAYWVYGTGQPLMLLTGLAMPAITWGPLPALLGRQGYQAIVMDNRDSGISSVCDGMDYAISDMASDCAAVLDDLGIRETYLLGISMGGFIAQEFALSHPERIERLMLLATGPGIGGGLPPETELMDAFFNPPSGEDQGQASTRLISLLSGPGWAEKNKRLVRFAVSRLPDDIAEVARHWVASATFSSWDRLEELKCPVLIMHGDSDSLIPLGNGENLAQRIPKAQLIKLEGAGHLIPLERPGDLVKAISTFFPLPPKQSSP